MVFELDSLPPHSVASLVLKLPAISNWESYSHTFLFRRVQQYIQWRDWESAIFIAERLIAILQQALQTDESTLDAASGEPNSASRATLLLNLENVTHLLARATYDSHNGRIPSMMSSSSSIGGLGSGSGAASSLGDGASQPQVEGHAGGASYAYHLLKKYHQFTEENQFFYAQCW